jgi:hypothetical protein
MIYVSTTKIAPGESIVSSQHESECRVTFLWPGSRFHIVHNSVNKSWERYCPHPLLVSTASTASNDKKECCLVLSMTHHCIQSNRLQKLMLTTSLIRLVHIIILPVQSTATTSQTLQENGKQSNVLSQWTLLLHSTVSESAIWSFLFCWPIKA